MIYYCSASDQIATFDIPGGSMKQNVFLSGFVHAEIDIDMLIMLNVCLLTYRKPDISEYFI